jgi:hypothetical protein
MAVGNTDAGHRAQMGRRAALSTSAADNNELIDTFLECQARAIRWQLRLAILFLIVGGGLIGIGTLLSQQIEGSFLKSALLSVAGVFSSTLSAFPIKDFLARREKADALRLLKARLNRMVREGGNDAEVARIDETLWKALNVVIER